MEENLKDYWKNDKRILKAEQEATRDKELYEKAINNQITFILDKFIKKQRKKKQYNETPQQNDKST